MKAPEVGKKVYAAVMFVAVSVLSGLLAAGLVVPAAAVVGTTLKSGADLLGTLPVELEEVAQAESSRVLLADGSLLATFFTENRDLVTLDQIAPIMQTAQVAIEDNRFYEHGALDLRGTLRALITTGTGGGTQGGSTLTQQYVKQSLISAASARGDTAGVAKAQERTLSRKFLELRYANAIEQKFSKQEILQRYLNIAYYGDGAYGVEAAAHHYFNTKAKDLTLAQAAMLAGLVQNPAQTDPVNHPLAAIERRNVVLNRMVQLDLITAEEAAAAKQETFDKTKVQPTPNGCVGTRYPFVCDYVRQVLLNSNVLGATVDDRKNALYRGGLTIKTSIEPAMQDAAQKAILGMVKPTDPAISTMVEVQPGTGYIKAMAQSRSKMGTGPGETFYNYSVSSRYGGAEGYQAGSTFKAFTMAAAFEKGIPAAKTYDARSPMQFSGTTFKSCAGKFLFRQNYEVRNSTGVNGIMDMMRGAAYSVNTYFLQLERDTGICESATMADRLGAQLANGQKLAATYDNFPSFTLGVAEVTPLSMAEAYATFAARGMHCSPIIITSITTLAGDTIEPPKANCQQVVAPEVADAVNKVLKNVVDNGTGRRVRMFGGDRDQAGKTGTIDSNAAVWFVGYTPALAGAAMIAVDKKRPDFFPKGSLKGVKLPSGTYLEGSGSGDAGRIYKPAMEVALEKLPATKFTEPPANLVRGARVGCPSVLGMNEDAAKATLEAAGFTVSKANVYDNSPPGTFLGVQCSGFAFGTAYLLISIGPRVVIQAPPPVQQPPNNAGGGGGGNTGNNGNGNGR